MFLHLLNTPQKQAFFALATEMISADGIISDEEIDYMDRLAQEAGLHGDQSPGEGDGSRDMTVFNSRESKIACALELLILAVVDGKFHIKESAFAIDIIDMLDLDEPTHDALCGITNDAIGILKTMQALIDTPPADPTAADSAA